MTRILIMFVGLLATPTFCVADKPQDVPISKLGSEVRLIGKLN